MGSVIRVCAIEGCGKAHKTRGWCGAHYARWRRHGDPLGGRTFEGDLLAFLENTVIPFEGDDCLIWPFATNGAGYGQIKIDGKNHLVSRVVCEREHGPPPTQKHEAAHSCGKGHEGCVNRKHLEWKTRAENQADRLTHGTHSRGDRHGAAKLTEAQVLGIRASTRTYCELAKEYGVSKSLIFQIKTRKGWAWLAETAA